MLKIKFIQKDNTPSINIFIYKIVMINKTFFMWILFKEKKLYLILFTLKQKVFFYFSALIILAAILILVRLRRFSKYSGIGP